MRIVLFLLICLALACSKSESPSGASQAPAATTEKPATEPAPARPGIDPPPGTIQLTHSGEAPLRKLRWSFTKGQKQTVTIERALMAAARAGDGVAPKTAGPTLTFELGLVVEDVAADGTARVGFVVNEAEAATSDPSADLGKEMQEGVAINHLRGMRGRYQVGANGVVKNIEIDEPDGVSHRTHQAIETVRLALMLLTVPVPDGEVGQSSQWTITRPSMQFEIATTERLTLGVRKFEEDGVNIRMFGQSTGEPQSVTSRGTNKQEFEVLALNEQVRVDGTWQLDRLAPELATSTAKNQMKIRNPGVSGEVREMETFRETTLTFTSK